MEVGQFEFGLVATPLTKFGPLVEGLLRVGEADESNFTQADPAPVMARLICTGPQQDGPLDGWGEATVAYIPDVAGQGRLRSLGVIELLDCLGLDDPVFVGEGVGLGRGVKGGPMLSYPPF